MSETYRYREERKQAERAKQQEQKKKKSPKKGSLWKKILLACIILGVLSIGTGVITFAVMIKDVPSLDASKLVDPLSTKFYDRNGKFLYEYGKEKRTKITYNQVPKKLEHAFVATEDSHFYEHHGIDIKRTAKAIFMNVTGDFGSQGGSTITQQVIKNSFLTPQKTLKRKVQEWYLAYKLEQKYSKHEILMMYFNKIYLGNRSYGVAAAAKNYYGLDANKLNKLTLPEAAMIAGLPQSPNNYDPTKPKNKEAATARRNLVLSSMHRQGYITKKQMQDAMKVPVTKGLVKKKNQGMPYEAFIDAAVKEVEGKMKNVDIGTAGLSIYMTLDPKAQDYANKMMNTNEIISYPNERFQGAFVFLDSKTGEVRAIGSGRNEYKAGFLGNNFAVDLIRQPGSTFKPILDYGPAIEYLNWSTHHQLNDQPTTYSTGQQIQNWDRRYHGMMSIRTALQWSYNIPALLTLREVGMDRAKNFAKQLGITFDHNQIYESYAIGGNTVSPLEMAGAYSAFANQGVYNQPHFVQKVVFPNGKVKSFKPKPKQVMHDYTAYMITDMLRDVVDSGTGKAANVPWLDVAGKTGTTNFDERTSLQYGYPLGNVAKDSWFTGYTPQYTMSVWTGYVKNGSGNYLPGDTTHIAQIMFSKMMQAFGTDTSTFQQPSDVYQMGNDLYIRGAAEVPPPPKPVVQPKKIEEKVVKKAKAWEKQTQKEKSPGNQKWQEKKQKENGKNKNH
ncbi:PBP1A family penicillin-binding protein [Neobacillus niacini]|uniref:transglycosylase domain-containing protein n=1 Tax=Neobacillus niacini TaxID=86668 RepID=UPI0028673DDC|nr:PBP1A family penicillin-binding protein [Neobacillus niacini]MDR7000260.1 penicillin-binding protein 1A [Neobacillus niacini]